MGLSREESISKYGTERYTGWNEPEAGYDARALGITGGGGGGGDGGGSLLSQMGPSIDKYVQDLIDFANEDYNFAAKWIEDQFVEAMGSDDQARKDFLKEVANSLEARIGTVAYDYETDTYRLNQDTSTALRRLEEDERIARQNLDTTAQLERETQGASLNARGLINAPRAEQQGLGGKFIGQLESDIQRRKDSISRVVGREREDTLLGQERGLADITTNARRLAAGEIDQRDYGLERSERERQRRILEAEEERKRQKDILAAMEGYVA